MTPPFPADAALPQGPDAGRELEAFAHAVSHDLRAPLRHLDGFANLLVTRLEGQPGALDEKSRHYLGRITDAARTMGSLLDDLLVYSRLAHPGTASASVDLDGLVASLRAEFPPGPAWDLAPLGQVKGVPAQLRLVFQNLLGNAVKFSASVSDPRVWVRRAGTRSGRIIFEVGDNGVGFDPAFADRIFGVFQRFHPREDFPGNGIGLAIVARAIRQHGGEVWAESQPGEGARFSFTLEAAGGEM
ncbi:MAG: ATP-binding protein [Holophaga sp.]|nr:ATP-binding protein [Holophaga sp.]